MLWNQWSASIGTAGRFHWIAQLDEMQRRIEDNPDILTRRKAIVEHPFGTIKWSMGHGYFLMKGIPKTSAEMSLSFLAYNIKRAIKILGVPKMIEALG